MPGIALVVGHTTAARGNAIPGAVDAPFTEWEYNLVLANQVHALLQDRGVPAVVLLRSPRSGYQEAAKAVAREANRWGASLVVEFHCNGAPFTLKANRTEGVHLPGSVRGAALAKAVAKAVASVQGWAYKVIAQARSWNGPTRTGPDGKPLPGGPPLYILQDTQAPAVILESSFFSMGADHQAAPGLDKALASLADGTLAKAVADALIAHLSV